MFHQKNDKKNSVCLSDETIAGFAEGLLSGKELATVQLHLDCCPSCVELLSIYQSVRQRQNAGEMMNVPTEMLQKARNLIPGKDENILELVVRFSEKMFEAVRTTGKVLWGPGIQSAYALRAETAEPAQVMVVQKDFPALRIEITIAREKKSLHNLFVRLSAKPPFPLSAAARASLWQEQSEIESHPISRGEIAFQKIKPGVYHLKIRNPQSETLAAIALELIAV